MKRKCAFLVVIALVVALLAICVPAAADTWNPVNTDGFGEGNDNYDVLSMSVFGSYLYAGTWNPDYGCQVWRSFDGTAWTQVVGQDPPVAPDPGPGFGDNGNMAAGCMSVFGSYLYVGTWNFDNGCQVWRSPDGTAWTQVVGGAVAPDPGPGFGDSNNQCVFSMSVFDSCLYAGTFNQETGCEVWKSSDGTTWNQANTGGFGDGNNYVTSSMSVFGSYLYAGTWNGGTGCQVWRSPDGTTWNPANIAGYGDVNNQCIYSMSVFGSYLYVGTTGCLVYRSSDGTTWNQVVGQDPPGTPGTGPGFGDENNWYPWSMSVFDSCLYAGTFNQKTGCEVWKSSDGTTWNQANTGGFGYEHTVQASSLSVFGSYLYVGTTNGYEGCQVWRTLGTNVVKASVIGGHGSVDPATQEVEFGSPASIKVTPDAGYHTASVTDNGSQVTISNPYIINNVTADHDVVVTFASDNSTWFLAEGTNAWGFSTYITVENPNKQQVTAKLTYMDPNPQSGAGVVGTRDVALPPLSQTTVSSMQDIGPVDFSTKVESLHGKPITVDRTMYWTGEGAASPEGHSSIGTTAPSKTWYLPEGSSAWGFETWTLLQNPNATDAQVRLTYMVEGGTPRSFDRIVPANSRATCFMATDIGAADASIQVASDVPVIAERSQYRNNRREGSCSIGSAAPAREYFLAEGTTAWGFTTYVLVQNPNGSDAQVTLTYMTPEGPMAQPPFALDANSRRTVRVNDALPNTDLSTRVSSDKPIIAERAMYWGEGTPAGEAMHDSIGLDSPHMTFMLPDGQTSNGFETWTLVQNPNESAVTVEVSYLKAGGGAETLTSSIPANSRKTFNMADKVTSGRASIMVNCKTAGKKIMAERAMYWNTRGAGTDTIGGYSD